METDFFPALICHSGIHYRNKNTKYLIIINIVIIFNN